MKKNVIFIRNLLINEANIAMMCETENDNYNVKKLLNNNNLSQSQSIRFGQMFQKFLKEIIKNCGYELIHEELLDIYKTGSKTNKGKKDLDVCFIKDNKIYYYESKINLNLDSEKAKATDEKIKAIIKFLSSENPDKEIVGGLITCWWKNETDLPIKTKSPLCFIQDFFNILEITDIDEQDYLELMREFGREI